jgi:LysM repeat protein
MHEYMPLQSTMPELMDERRMRYRLQATSDGGRAVSSSGPRPQADVKPEKTDPQPPKIPVAKATSDGSVTNKESKAISNAKDGAEHLQKQHDQLESKVSENLDQASIRENGGPATSGNVELDNERSAYEGRRNDLRDGTSTKEFTDQISDARKNLSRYKEGSDPYNAQQQRIADLQSAKADRMDAETEVVEAAKDKRALVGNIDAQILANRGETKDYDEDVDAMTKRADKFLDQFKADNGQVPVDGGFLDDADWSDAPDDLTGKEFLDMVSDGNSDNAEEFTSDEFVNRNGDAAGAAVALQNIARRYNDRTEAYNGVAEQNEQLFKDRTMYMDSLQADLEALSPGNAAKAGIKETSPGIERMAKAAGIDTPIVAPAYDGPYNFDRADRAKTARQSQTGNSNNIARRTVAGDDGVTGTRDDEDLTVAQVRAQRSNSQTTTGSLDAAAVQKVIQAHGGLSDTYTVKSNDYLYGIADQYKQQYNVDLDVNKIAAANGIADPNTIYAGTKIDLGAAVREQIAAQAQALRPEETQPEDAPDRNI